MTPGRSLNYGKFICNVFGWDTVNRGIFRSKVQFRVWILNVGLFKNFFYMRGDSKFVVCEI